MPDHEETTLAPREEVGITRASIEKTKNEIDLLNDFVQSVLKKGQDYGTVPGIPRDFLWKPGADNIIAAMKCHSESHVIGRTVDPITGFVMYEHEAFIKRNDSGMVVAQGVGCCTNQEVKYRYRDEQRKCPHCNKAAIIRGKPEYGGGWLCFARKGGCGAKWNAGAPEIEDQKTGQIENPDPLDQANTIMKMSEKRAVVDAALKLPGVARMFTQDMEPQSGEPAPDSQDAPESRTAPPQRQAQPSQGGRVVEGSKAPSKGVCKKHGAKFAKGKHPIHDGENNLIAWCFDDGTETQTVIAGQHLPQEDADPPLEA